MRTIIAGSRDFTDFRRLAGVMAGIPWPVTKVLSGAARGADAVGEQWAHINRIPLIRYPADWDTHGKSAGYLRNKQMAENADALVAFWDGQSKGTDNMIKLARTKGLLVVVIRTDLPADAEPTVTKGEELTSTTHLYTRNTNPTERGTYACRVDQALGPHGVLYDDIFLIWDPALAGWYRPHSPDKYKAPVHGWIGPLERFHPEPKVEEPDDGL